jgi:hypothetical protein
MKGARVDDGLFLPGYRPRQCADLLLASTHVEVQAGDVTGALGWDEFEAMDQDTDRHDVWIFAPWSKHEYQPVGLVIRGRGRCAVETMPVIAARASRRNRWAAPGGYPSVPLTQISPLLGAPDQDWRLLDGLCAALAAREDLRARLDEPGRVALLVQDLQDGGYGSFLD